MVTFGLDLSHHNDLRLDLAQCRREGIEFVFIKSTEGANFVDPEFLANLTEARNAGMLVAAYHYVRSAAAASDQAAWISHAVPRDVPVILDVEANSGSIALTRDLVARLRKIGYRVPLLYLPRWYWQQIGSPSLAGLPPLWSSRYPDNVVGDLGSEWSRAQASYWTGYGGLEVAVLQFTSSARIAGYQPLDANAFRGTRAELAALLGGTPAPSIEEDDMQLIKGDKDPTTFVVYWNQAGAIAVRKKIPNTNDPGYLAATETGYTVKTVAQDVIDRIPDATAPKFELDYGSFVDDLAVQLASRLPAAGAALTPGDIQQIAQASAVAVVAEFKREGN
jgi:GH25 family lysozyme M1 (1,4-beta-N-acetylmuramidase)